MATETIWCRLKTAYDKQTQVVLFSSTAIALYGYDQGMMSMINTNYSYLSTMQIASDSPLVGLIVAVYYLGCGTGAVLFSKLSDDYGRKKSIFACLATASLGNWIMFIAGLGGWPRGALVCMFIGRVVMGLGVGGIDCVIPTYSSELSKDEARGKALAQEFQSNIFGLVMAFAINLGVTVGLGKWDQWAWRIPIVVMQVYPVLLIAVVGTLPESPRWLMYHGLEEKCKDALQDIYGVESEQRWKELKDAHEEERGHEVNYLDMVTPGHPQFHPTIITIMGQINQALTGYGAVSVYGPQIFELLGFPTTPAEFLTLANYISYFLLMTLAWLLIDAMGRRKLLLHGSLILTISFLLLTVFGGLAKSSMSAHIPVLALGIPGTVVLFVATGAFGIGWLTTVWLIPTEIYPTTARAQGTAISVIIWGLANFAVTLLTPIFFNNLSYFLFLIFAGTNAVAGLWTWVYLPESGGRSFEENIEFFEEAKEAGTWHVRRVKGGEFTKFLVHGGEDAEHVPLLRRVGDQIPDI